MFLSLKSSLGAPGLARSVPPYVEQDFLFTVDAFIGDTITITLDQGESYNGTIDWGDGSSLFILSGSGYASATHTYQVFDTYQVRVSGSIVPFSIPSLQLFNQQNIVSVENLGTIGWTNFNSMFLDCFNLASFNAGNSDTSNVTNMNSMFAECIGLTSINVSSFDTSNVTNMISMFQNCNSLTSLNLESFDTSNVALFDLMFGGCTLLNQLQLPLNFVTASCTRAISMFLQCSSLLSLDVSSWITSNVVSMSNMFNSMSAMADITGIENFDITGITPAGGLNSFCRETQLTTATYNDLLINFEAQYNAAPIPRNDLQPWFKATATGAAALAARTSLINNYNWVITDQT